MRDCKCGHGWADHWLDNKGEAANCDVHPVCTCTQYRPVPEPHSKSWQEQYCEDYTAKLKTSRCECGHEWNNAGMHFCSRFGSITEWEVANREAAGVYDDYTGEAYPI